MEPSQDKFAYRFGAVNLLFWLALLGQGLWSNPSSGVSGTWGHWFFGSVEVQPGLIVVGFLVALVMEHCFYYRYRKPAKAAATKAA